MKFNVYAVRDLKNGFLAPFCEQSNESAKRTFAKAVLSDSMMGFAPTDFQLFLVGYYDTNTGHLMAEEPVYLACGGDYQDA